MHAEGFVLPLLVALLALLLLVGGTLHQLYRRMRFSLGDFLVLILLTGLAVGLAAKAVPLDEPWLAAGASLVAGGLIFAVCVVGLEQAGKLDVEGFARRAWFQVRMVLVLACGALALTALGAICAGWRHQLSFALAGLTGLGWLLGLLHAVARDERTAEALREERETQARADEKNRTAERADAPVPDAPGAPKPERRGPPDA